MSLASREGIGPPAGHEAIPPITEPYVLFVCVPIEVDEQGRRWTSASWAKDLALHLDYLTDLTLVSPLTRKGSANLVPLDGPPFDRLKFIDLPSPASRGEALRTLPRQVLQYWRAIGRGRVVHAGFAGWPFAQGWLAVPLARFRRRFVLANVESSFWRATDTERSWRKRWWGRLGEILTRACLRMADLRLFTSKMYLQQLLSAGSPRAYVTPATWLNEEWILGEGEAVEHWDAKTGRVRMVFAGRLVPEKGVSVLLAAIRAAAEAGADAEFAIIGSGLLRDECVAAARSLAGKAELVVLDEVPYGTPFLNLLRGFDAVLLPSLSDEQPRIVFDALAQAIPVVGSATGGIREVVESGVNGRLSPPNDVGALAESLVWASRDRARLRELGLRGPASVRHSTHEAMHRNRHRILRQALDEG
jgi:glycosyltransferase involved in cell wall biosynthesis